MNPTKIAAILHQRIAPGGPFIIGIDGAGGAGKSVLADQVAGELMSRAHAVALIKMDDFYQPNSAPNRGSSTIGAGFDWRRLEKQVLKPAKSNQPIQYQRYDWTTDSLGEWHEASARVVIVEGIYSTRIELEEFYDFTIWVECPHRIRLARGVQRDGESVRDRWLNEWMPEEDRYVAEHSPQTRADLVYDGSDRNR